MKRDPGISPTQVAPRCGTTQTTAGEQAAQRLAAGEKPQRAFIIVDEADSGSERGWGI
jgi:hypothetical protein